MFSCLRKLQLLDNKLKIFKVFKWLKKTFSHISCYYLTTIQQIGNSVSIGNMNQISVI